MNIKIKNGQFKAYYFSTTFTLAKKRLSPRLRCYIIVLTKIFKLLLNGMK